MKEFDKWWKANTDHWGYIHEMGQTPIAKDSWKAALKWVMTRVMYDPDDRGIDYGIIPDIDFIEEELNG